MVDVVLGSPLPLTSESGYRGPGSVGITGLPTSGDTFFSVCVGILGASPVVLHGEWGRPRTTPAASCRRPPTAAHTYTGQPATTRHHTLITSVIGCSLSSG
ncbi:hypothetical protein B9Q03_12375 [Candidatus Marsarchaeota G2 archaeon OSP_D]|uniref:Uncharacterized protein n=1 Tax=Candidatus Marsarchaeota G2 archaeon OSP_D TaxID=1978157 RepID=A0A2R6AG55_9ARCH|nr:MAG: hypothetical protein B9Q03_12375 [Candidatus Marsarchaeota G2 archaeon OSP_D]